MDTQTLAPFITQYMCGTSSGKKHVSQVVAESLVLSEAGGARRRMTWGFSTYRGDTLIEPFQPESLLAEGTWQPTTAVVTEVRDSAAVLYLGPLPGQVGPSYAFYLERRDSILLYRMPMGNGNCGGTPIVGGDRLARFTKRQAPP